MKEFLKTVNRDFYKGFIRGNPGKDGQLYESSHLANGASNYAGLLCADKNKNSLAIDVKGKIEVGQSYEILGPNMHREEFVINEIHNQFGQSVNEAHPGTGIFNVIGPKNFVEHAIVARI
jgi:hypothetical protein